MNEPVYEFKFDEKAGKKGDAGNRYVGRPVLAPGLVGLVFAVVVGLTMIVNVDQTPRSLRVYFLVMASSGVMLLMIYHFIINIRPYESNEYNSVLGAKLAKGMKFIGFFMLFLSFLGIIIPQAGYWVCIFVKRTLSLVI